MNQDCSEICAEFRILSLMVSVEDKDCGQCSRMVFWRIFQKTLLFLENSCMLFSLASSSANEVSREFPSVSI